METGLFQKTFTRSCLSSSMHEHGRKHSSYICV